MKNFFARFSRRTWIIIGVVLVLIIGGVIYTRSRSSKQSSYETATIGRGNLVATVGATGSVHAQQSAVLMWQTTGTVKEVNVQVGDHVKKDQVLASLDKNTLSQNIILAEADLASAQKALDDLVNSDTAYAQAVRSLDTAETNYQKAYDYRKTLNGKITIVDTYWKFDRLMVRKYLGYADAETIKDADEKLALAQAQLDDARRAVENFKNGVNPTDVESAKARVAAAQATLNMAQIDVPFDGTVTQANPVVGDQVSTGTTAFRVDDLSHLQVDLQVSEVDINNVAIGQNATLTFDAILNKEYHGKVVKVGQAGDTISGVVSFTVTVELTDPDELVKPGMTSAVNVIVNEQKNVLLVPNRAVRLTNGDRVVYMQVNGKLTPFKVKLGSTDGTNSVLVGGDLKEGDSIILNPPSFSGPFGGG